MKSVLCLETFFTEVPFEERFALAKEAGFEYVEFWTWKAKDLQQIKRLCEEHGLKVVCFSGDESFSLVDKAEHAQYISFAKESIEAAKYLGCSKLVIHSNALGHDGAVLNHYNNFSAEEKYANTLAVLKELASIAEREQVTFLLEPLNTKVDHRGNYLAFSKDAAKLIKEVGSANLRILYDAYHMQIMEGNLIGTITEYVDLIGHIHIADVPGRHEPGTGEINYQQIIKSLQGLGYDRGVGFELFPAGESMQAATLANDLVSNVK
ncbi:hydroxypyruvate isomerase family protein [Dethiobacter alkaliphilus]|uniref:hydroxypyruvate isomerase family protein n=1 Tax=Dethiobacter alkaliphilus TaxID=427926 RepID=UPI002226CAD1|nr:TIM barrel protein [Dethiobacter alkaliphilus]MCW3489983.1 TIM barrel protein [Dethiobacter alkaliphilus]